MLYPKITEVVRAGSGARSVPQTQRELVALSIRLKPSVKTARPVIEWGLPRAIVR
jgi:hypothetical protein